MGYVNTLKYLERYSVYKYNTITNVNKFRNLSIMFEDVLDRTKSLIKSKVK